MSSSHVCPVHHQTASPVHPSTLTNPLLSAPKHPSNPDRHTTYCTVTSVRLAGNAAQVTSKSFNFAAKRKLPFFFVSASDGTNVVKIFNMAILAGMKWKAAPKDDFYQEVGKGGGGAHGGAAGDRKRGVGRGRGGGGQRGRGRGRGPGKDEGGGQRGRGRMQGAGGAATANRGEEEGG